MFVLVFDTSLMNVSISSVVHDLGTTVSSVQAAIALEALVSAAFILIGSKVGDLIGRKRAYVIGLLGYAAGALAMTLAQSVTAIIVFWAVIGGLGASLLMPAMQSLIHGNFQGAGAEAGLCPGRSLGGGRRGDRTAARRVHHDLPLVAGRLPARARDHRDRVARFRAHQGRAVHGTSPGRRGRRGPVRPRHGRHSSSASWRGRRWGRRRRAPDRRGGGLGIVRAVAPTSQARGEADAARSGSVPIEMFRFGISGQLLQNVSLGAAMTALPIFLEMASSTTRSRRVCRSLRSRSRCWGGGARWEEGGVPTSEPDHPLGFALLAAGMVLLIASCLARTPAGTCSSRC